MGIGEELRPTVGKAVYAAAGAAAGHFVPKWYHDWQERKQRESDERYASLLRKELSSYGLVTRDQLTGNQPQADDRGVGSKVDQLSSDVRQLSSLVSDLAKSYKAD